MVRSAWQNLNGVWQFAEAGVGQAPPFGQTLPESILVPFPVESPISGIMRSPDRMWYRRTFTVPAGWGGQRVLLQFGAVDWEASVYVNGVSVGTHRGGYDSFSFDITPRLNGGTNELIVGVFDPSDAGEQPIGKQRNVPGGIWYTTASGIWQTVWLEPAPAARITRLDMRPDLAANQLRVTVHGAGISGQTVEAVALNGTTAVGSATGSIGAEIRIPVPTPRLWSPDDPFLYNLRVSLKSGSTTVDQVASYFGMRSISVATIGGVLRPVLNGRLIFQIGTLDQGYWPDGIYTAPTDAALRFDLEKHKELGYNMVRKHIKVEPARWFYWADRLGLLVWQDMPAMRAGLNPSAGARTQFESELREMIDEHRSFTSIVMWVPFNEGWGQYDQARLASLVKSWDPSRLVNNMSGVNCCGAVDGGNGDVVDDHVYVGPGSPTPSTTRAAVLGEFGGLGLRVDGHMWDSGAAFAYEMQPTSAALLNRYVGLVQQLRRLMIEPGLNAAVYTEITDVENEINGMLTYDRRVMKVDVAATRNAHLGLINASSQITGRLAVNRYASFEVSTPGFTGRYIRHLDSLGFTEVVGGGSSPTLKQDATFRVLAGLADATCYSFESRNFPGHFLRHSGFRISRDPRDGSAIFDQDATFCAQPGLSGSGVTFQSYNFPDRAIRHINAQVWIANNSSANAWDNPASYAQDATWAVVVPWAP